MQGTPNYRHLLTEDFLWKSNSLLIYKDLAWDGFSSRFPVSSCNNFYAKITLYLYLDHSLSQRAECVQGTWTLLPHKTKEDTWLGKKIYYLFKKRYE